MNVQYIEHPQQTEANKQPSSVALGNFDGLHLGHQQVIRKAIDIAKKAGFYSGVMTFFPHPKEILGPIQHPSYLTPLPDKLQLFEDLGVDFTKVIRFSPSFSTLTPEEFIQQYVVDLNVKQVITGFDFRFGHKGLGSIETLRQWAQRTQDFEVHTVPSIDDHNQKISSSRIRELLSRGEVQEVFSLLKRRYEVRGQVVHGQKMGRTIGFPTANIEMTHPYVLPMHGVYAVLVEWNDQKYEGVLNIGIKPTIEQKAPLPTIEVYLFDFETDIYSEHLSLQFISFLRSEKKFESLDHLKNQIALDVQQAKKQFELIKK